MSQSKGTSFFFSLSVHCKILGHVLLVQNCTLQISDKPKLACYQPITPSQYFPCLWHPYVTAAPNVRISLRFRFQVVRSVNGRHKQYKIKKCIVAQCTTITHRLQLASCCIDWSAEYPFMLWQSAVNLESLQCRYKSGVKCWFEFTCRVPLRPLISWSKM